MTVSSPRRSQLTNRRHIAASLVVSMLIGIIGTVVAAGPLHETTDSAAPAMFHLAWPHVGDRGHYEFEGNATFRFPWWDGINFTVYPDMIDYNDTDPTWANRMAWTVDLGRGTVDFSTDFPVHYEPGSGKTVAMEWGFNSSSSYPAGPTNPTTFETNSAMHSTEFGPEWLGVCGARSVLQGRVWNPIEPIKEFGSCEAGRVWRTKEGTLLGRGEVAGATTRTIIVDWLSSSYNGTMARLWLQEAIPYPIRIAFPVDPWQPDRQARSYNLVAFERGTIPIRGAPEADLAPLPALALASRQPWVLDDSGIAHAFPLSRAWSAAKADAQYADLREFLSTHPSAYAGQASMVDRIDQKGMRSVTWTVLATDGTDFLKFSVSRTALAALPPLPFGNVLEQISFETQTYEPNDDVRYFPVDVLPTQTPTVGSLWKQYLAFRPALAKPAPNSWSINLACFAAPTQTLDEACPGPHVRVSAGYAMETFNSTTGGPVGLVGTMEAQGAVLGWRGSGFRMTSYTEWDSSFGSGLPQSPLAGGTAAAPSNSDVVAFSVGDSGFWAWPAAAQARAVGFAAVLLGLAYWFWPAGKAGVIGLFSRVRADKLMDSPVRARLVAHIEGAPGIHQQALVRALDKGNGAVEHHLDKLVAAGIVERRKAKGYVCYFPAGTGRRAMAAAAVLKSQIARAIHEAALREPGIHPAELARRLSVTPATIHYHVERLRQAGALQGRLDGAVLRLSAAMSEA